MKKRVLIIGAGIAQVPLIQKVQAMGFEVVVASIPGPYPGFEVANKAYHVDVRDKEKLLRIARDEKVVAVLTDQTDLPVTSVAWVAEHMGLPGIGVECAMRFTNKDCMRKACRELGIPVPRSYASDCVDALMSWASEVGYPVMVKPVDSQGSRGVVCVNNTAELETAFYEARRYSATSEVLVEEFFVGREVVIDGFAINGSFTNLVTGDRSYFDLPRRFIPNATLFPTNIRRKLKDRLLEINTCLITGFGLPFGITQSEYLVNEQSGEIILVEVAARGGGVFISSDLIPLSCGIDVNELLIHMALGEAVSLNLDLMIQAASGYVSFTLPEGVIIDPPNTDELRAVDGVYRAYLDDLVFGKEIYHMENKSMREGPILIKARSRSELDAVCERVRRTLRIGVSTPDGVCGPIWE